MLYGIKDAARSIIKKKSDGKVWLYTDYCNSVNIEITGGNTVYALANGTKAIRWDSGREGKIKMSCQIYDLRFLSMLSGSDWVEGSISNAQKREVLTVASGNKVTLAETPMAGSLAIFLPEADGFSNGEELTEGTPATTPKTFSLTGKEVTLNATTCEVGSKVIVYYLYTTVATAKQLAFKFNQYPGNFEIYGFSAATNKETGVNEFLEFHIPNCKPLSNCTINFDSENATTLDMEFDIFYDSATGNMIEFNKI